MTTLALRGSPNQQSLDVVKKASSDGCSAWLRDEKKLDEVLAFHGKQRSSQDLLAEFKAQQRTRKQNPESPCDVRSSPRRSGDFDRPDSNLTETSPTTRRSRKQPQKRSPTSLRGEGSEWKGDRQKLDEVLTFHAKQRSSEELVAEFREQSQRARSASPPGQTASPGLSSPETDAPNTSVGSNGRTVGSPGSRSHFAAGCWEGDVDKLDMVLAFQEKQRPSHVLLSEFKRGSRSSSVQSSPALRESSASILSTTSCELSGVEELELSEGSKSPKRSQGLSAWNGDKERLDEVLAFHSKQRSSEDLVKEFQAQQRARKEKAAERKGKARFGK